MLQACAPADALVSLLVSVMLSRNVVAAVCGDVWYTISDPRLLLWNLNERDWGRIGVRARRKREVCFARLPAGADDDDDDEAPTSRVDDDDRWNVMEVCGGTSRRCRRRRRDNPRLSVGGDETWTRRPRRRLDRSILPLSPRVLNFKAFSRRRRTASMSPHPPACTECFFSLALSNTAWLHHGNGGNRIGWSFSAVRTASCARAQKKTRRGRSVFYDRRNQNSLSVSRASFSLEAY